MGCRHLDHRFDLVSASMHPNDDEPNHSSSKERHQMLGPNHTSYHLAQQTYGERLDHAARIRQVQKDRHDDSRPFNRDAFHAPRAEWPIAWGQASRPIRVRWHLSPRVGARIVLANGPGTTDPVSSDRLRGGWLTLPWRTGRRQRRSVRIRDTYTLRAAVATTAAPTRMPCKFVSRPSRAPHPSCGRAPAHLPAGVRTCP